MNKKFSMARKILEDSIKEWDEIEDIYNVSMEKFEIKITLGCKTFYNCSLTNKYKKNKLSFQVGRKSLVS